MELVGQQLGAYRILSLLGRGGTAEVYKAFDPDLKREVAVKVLLSEVSHDQDWVRRFRQEAELLAQLDHPHILPIYAAGKHEGRPYLVMKYMGDGQTLRTELSGTPWPLNRVVKVITQVADALDSAHGAGVVHRDIKPSNILVTSDLRCLVFDFGIAKPFRRDEKTTGSGIIVGTPEFMSPEQCRGEKLDHRSDVYSLGVLTYQMLTGRVPFSAETAVGILMKHLTEPLPIPPKGIALPPAVNAVLKKAMARDPAGRFHTAGEFGEAFRKSADQRPTVTLHAAEIQRAAAPTLRRPAWVRKLRSREGRVALAGLALLGMVGAIYATWPAAAPPSSTSSSPSLEPSTELMGPPVPSVDASPVDGPPPQSNGPPSETGSTPAPDPAAPAVPRRVDVPAGSVNGANAPSSTTLPGSLEIQSSEPATVWLDGERLGTAPGSFASIAPGPHSVTVDAGRGRVRKETVTVTAGSTHMLRFDFADPPASPSPGDGAAASAIDGGPRSVAAGEELRPPRVRTWTGFLTDEKCGVRGGKQGVLHLRCVELCIREGKQPMLYSRGRLYRLDGIENLTVTRDGPLSFPGWLELDTIHVVASKSSEKE